MFVGTCTSWVNQNTSPQTDGQWTTNVQRFIQVQVVITRLAALGNATWLQNHISAALMQQWSLEKWNWVYLFEIYSCKEPSCQIDHPHGVLTYTCNMSSFSLPIEIFVIFIFAVTVHSWSNHKSLYHAKFPAIQCVHMLSVVFVDLKLFNFPPLSSQDCPLSRLAAAFQLSWST